MIVMMKEKKTASVLVLTRLVFVCVFILRYVLLFLFLFFSYLLLVEFSFGLLL